MMRIALFAILTLAACTPLWAQQQTELPPPRLLIPTESGKETSLGLSRVDVRVEIAGPLAQTTMTMTFKNDTGRVLQGDLDFPLPDGATITGYGLDVNGIMVDGVPVEKQEARIAFEQEVHRGADPGLVEHTIGNAFRTRVYPIPANGTRTVKVQYVTGMLTSGSDLVDRVPLHWSRTIPEAHVTIFADRVGAFPKLQFGDRTQLLTFHKQGDSYAAEKTFENVAFDADLEVRLPDAAARSLSVAEPFMRASLGEPETYFVASDVPPMPLLMNGPRIAVHRIGIVWDASLSRRTAHLDRERQILRDLFRALGNVTVDLTILRNVAEPVRTFPITNGDSSALERFLKETVCDGGTQLGVAPFRTLAPNGTRYDFHLLFSDGLGDLGRGLPFPSAVPVYTLNSNATANHALLRHVAERSGGVYLNLNEISDVQAENAIGKPAFSLLSVTVEQGTVKDIFPNGQQPVQGRVLVTGRLATPEARLRLDYGTPGHVTYRETITIHRPDREGTGMVGRFWAQRKAADLELLPEQNREWLLSLGKDFNIVTPNTSLMVLERLDQYLAHHITPPRSSIEMYSAYRQAMQEQTTTRKAEEKNKLSQVLSWWQEKTAWWDRKFPSSLLKPRPRPATHPGLRGSAIGGRGVVGTSVTNLAMDRAVANDEVEEVAARPRSLSVGVAGGAPAATPPSGGALAGGGSAGGRAAGEPQALGAIVHYAAGDSNALRQGISDSTRGSSSAFFAAKMKAPDGAEGEDMAAAAVTIKAWSPDTPYLKPMKADAAHAYTIYLTQREQYATSPAFYLDCAEFLLQHGQSDLAVRVLTNILELRLEDAPLTRIVAHRLAQLGHLNLAIGLFEQVTRMRPEEPQSWRDLALVLADRADSLAQTNPGQALADDNRALELLNKIILGRWDRFEEIESVVLMEANRIIVRARRLPPVPGQTLKIPLDTRLIRNLDCDLRIVMTWDSDSTDMDLWVDEPTSERCMYSYNRTTIGGRLSKDFTDGYGPEEYLLHHAPKGIYKIRTNYFGEHAQRLTGGTTVQATVYTNFGRVNEKKQTLTLRLTTSKETVDIGTAKIE